MVFPCSLCFSSVVSGFPRGNVPRNCIAYSDLASEAHSDSPTTFYLLLVSHSEERISFYCPDEGGAKSHCKRASWMENVVMTVFEKYNSPRTLFGQFEKRVRRLYLYIWSRSVSGTLSR